MCTNRGFTLIEILIAVGLVALVAAGAVGATLSSRSMAVTAASIGFDSLLDAARTTAREFPHGATIAFTPDAYGDGFVARLYHNRPATADLEPTSTPPVDARVALKEAEALGSPAFAIVIHANGAVAGIIGAITNGSAAPETPCPASGSYRLTFSYGGAHTERLIPCRINLATTGSPSFAPITTASPASSPTISSCTGTGCGSIPVSPNPQATCPPQYFAKDPVTCVNPPLVVTPSSLTFSAAGVPPSLSYAVHEDLYIGQFQVTDNCAGAITDANAGGGSIGPDSSYNVASKSGNKTCVISVADNRGNTANIVVNTGVLSGLLPLSVCDQQSPARPTGTDIGPDPDGKHEDFSDGTTCRAQSTPTPSPTGTPPPNPMLIEAQVWIATNGTQPAPVTVDSETFLLYDDGSSGMGNPPPGTAWACANPQSAGVGYAGDSWPGFLHNTGTTYYANFQARFAQLYQEANDTGGDGRLSGGATDCP